jgi:hypothetical protein
MDGQHGIFAGVFTATHQETGELRPQYVAEDKGSIDPFLLMYGHRSQYACFFRRKTDKKTDTKGKNA